MALAIDSAVQRKAQERPADYGANNIMFTKETAERARAVLRAKFAQFKYRVRPRVDGGGLQPRRFSHRGRGAPVPRLRQGHESWGSTGVAYRTASDGQRCRITSGLW